MTGLSRAGYYRWRLPPPATPVAMELRSQLQQVAVEWPAYGYRRITAELQRRGFGKRQSNGIYAQACFGAEVEAW
jgi:hypothetical protein